MRSLRRVLTAASVFVLFFCLSSCATLGKNAPSEENLRTAVTGLWDAKVDFEWGYVYDHAVEEYKKYVKRKQFIRRGNLTIRSYEIEEIRPTGEGRADVRIRFTVAPMGLEMSGTTTEEWVWENGEWCLNLMPSLLKSPFGPMIKVNEAGEPLPPEKQTAPGR